VNICKKAPQPLAGAAHLPHDDYTRIVMAEAITILAYIIEI
jgi:hypothetical protein